MTIQHELSCRTNMTGICHVQRDLSFSFAPIGINYDGEDHLDLTGIARAARKAAQAEGDSRIEREAALRESWSQ